MPTQNGNHRRIRKLEHRLKDAESSERYWEKVAKAALDDLVRIEETLRQSPGFDDRPDEDFEDLPALVGEMEAANREMAMDLVLSEQDREKLKGRIAELETADMFWDDDDPEFGLEPQEEALVAKQLIHNFGFELPAIVTLQRAHELPKAYWLASPNPTDPDGDWVMKSFPTMEEAEEAQDALRKELGNGG